jgi:hypothetical protein
MNEAIAIPRKVVSTSGRSGILPNTYSVILDQICNIYLSCKVYVIIRQIH